MRTLRSAISISVVMALLVTACSDDDESSSTSTSEESTASVASSDSQPTETEPTDTQPTDSQESAPENVDDTTSTRPEVLAAVAEFTLRPGVNQLAVIGADAGTSLTLRSDDTTFREDGVADDQGSFLWREVPAGPYYVEADGAIRAVSDVVDVLAETEIPLQSFYSEQELPAGGFGYITMRDGTTLSANVLLPGPADGGPYPTVVEYSGYQPSDPGSTTFGQLFNALGYAYVGVNMRGTGCSGGSYLFFERAQSIDGYDMIEAVAAQPWVLDNEVGMGGISYPGISQLFVASTAPPSLAAITPLSVLDDSYRANGYPGGILNTGFAAEFVQERFDEAKIYGQEWAKERADAGDTVCADNQELRLQNPDFLALTEENIFYDPAVADILAPSTFVDQIDVPVFLAGAWQDEQTGGHFPDMLDDFTGSPHLYVDLLNGLHTDSLSPAVFARMVEFLDLYVAKRTPSLAGARGVAQVLVPSLYGVDDVVLPDDRFAGMSYADALAAFEAEPPVRVLFEQGTGGAEPGAPYPGFIAGFGAWPVPQAVATPWYFADGGVLAAAPPSAGLADSYTADPGALPPSFYAGGRSSDIWRADTVYDWQPIPAGTGVGYSSPPLEQDTVVVGTGSVDLWVMSSAEDTDLEVTISEVRPDGTEMYIQSGWLRASHRALDDVASTAVLPVQTHLGSDAAPLPAGELTAVRVELFPFAYAFRAGSQIRITIDAPGNSRPVWEFDTISDGETVTIAHDPAHPSQIVLPVITGVVVPPGVPACGSLRGQPCRTFVAAANEG
ncbi:MAG: CocE/NonD family hydrolase [Ilumatobacteraceae bacterium]